MLYAKTSLYFFFVFCCFFIVPRRKQTSTSYIFAIPFAILLALIIIMYIYFKGDVTEFDTKRTASKDADGLKKFGLYFIG